MFQPADVRGAPKNLHRSKQAKGSLREWYAEQGCGNERGTTGQEAWQDLFQITFIYFLLKYS